MDISAYQHMNIRMSTRGKRPLRNLTPSDKVRAIQRIHNGETKASVSRDIGVPESTLRGWCKNEQKLRFMCRQLGTADQLAPMSVIENPPEKRPRFENHIQTPKYPASSGFDEFGYNRLPLNGLTFPTNGSNAILEKIAFNEIMKKHMPADSNTKQPVENITNQMSSMMGGQIPLGGDYNTQLSIMQNLNLLSLLSPNLTSVPNLNSNGNGSLDIKNKIPLGVTEDIKDIAKANSSNGNINNTSVNFNNIANNTASLSVKNWAKDPAEKNLSNPQNTNTSSTITTNSPIGINYSINDSNNNSVKDKNGSFSVETSSDVTNFPSPLPLGLLQIPNISNTVDSENNNTALLEWCKVFNASLNFLALAAAAAALQPNSANTAIKKEDNNILYKELTKTANTFDSSNNRIPFVSSDVSNDSYFDSEPEDLSVRSITSKLSSPTNSRSQSPVKSRDSCSPLHSDAEN
ncbi:distal antenna-related [Cochliomyia hominivorax]